MTTICIFKTNTLICQFIDVGRFNNFLTLVAQEPTPKVIGVNQDHIRSSLLLLY